MAAPAEAMAVTLKADFGQFEKALLKAQNQTDAKLNQIEKKFGRSNAKVKTEATGMGSVFGNLQRQMGGLTAGLPGLSGGISGVGIAGAAAAIGVGALVGVLRGVTQATQFADDLETAADRIGVTVTALQELRYAADETDVPIANLEKGLENLNASLGAFKTGIGAGRITPIFESLGLTREALANVENAEQLLPILADRLGQVSDRATQVQLARKLGIEELLPLLRRGSSGINTMAGEARDLGLVLSTEVVAGLSATNRELELNQQRIDANVREMQASMAPFFSWATGELAKLSRGLGDFFNGLRDAQGRTDRVLEQQVERGQERVNFAMRQSRDTGRPMSAVQEKWVRDLAEARAELSRRRAERAAAPTPSAADRAGFEIDTPDTPPSRSGSRAGSAARDAERAAADALRRQRAFDDEIARASEATMQAQSQLATTAEQRASIAIQLLDSDRQQRAIDLERAVADGQLTEAQRDQIIEAERGLWLAREANVAAVHQRAIMDEAARLEDLTRGAALEHLQARAANATTAEERLAVDREILALHQAERRKALERALLQDDISEAERQILQALLAKLAATEAEEQGALLSSGQQAAKDVIGGIRQDAGAGDRNAQDRRDALDYIAQQERDGLLSHQDAMNARAQIDAAYWQNRLTGEKTMLNALAGLAQSSNKELAALGKAAAIAQATIDGYLAIQKAWASAPFPANLPAVAITTAGVAANVAAIAGVGLKDGGPVVGPGGPRDDKVLIWGSNGEFMMNARATAKNRPYLEAANRGADLGQMLPAFANGGVIGRVSAAAASVSGAPRAAPMAPVTFAPVINAPGASLAAVAAIERALDEQRRNFAADVNAVREKRAKWKVGGRR